jgi:hypothetical protein
MHRLKCPWRDFASSPLDGGAQEKPANPDEELLHVERRDIERQGSTSSAISSSDHTRPLFP